jgi:predicted TIM-barrel fold metal-dependent hydrolase
MSDEPFVIISSDGHATARMDDYADYLDPEFREEFQDFCVEFREKGTHTSEPKSLSARLDPYLVEEWIKTVIEPGRADGRWNPEKRIAHLDSDGVVADALIPDFGVPFTLYSPSVALQLGTKLPDRAHINAGNRAYNRWVIDFASIAPERFAAQAAIDFGHGAAVEDSLKEIRWAKEAGFKGVMLPFFSDELPLFDPVFEPIWSTLEDLELVVTSHTSLSGTSSRMGPNMQSAPHPACTISVVVAQQTFITHNVLDHLIWCGVLERHPRLKFVFTEQGSSWVPGALAQMDYSYDGSYRRLDTREVVKHRPSEYFSRQCYIGSSLLSRAEAEHRHEIGVDKMMFGTDYPHHEGSWQYGSSNYLQATLGAAGVPENEARMILGETIAQVYGFDMEKLKPIAERIGPRPSQILVPPERDLYPRGDVHKPFVGLMA